MYACTAAALALSAGDDEVKPQAAKALLEAAGYAQQAGTWVDAAGLTEVALLARAQLLPEPFDLDKHSDLAQHNQNALLELTAIRTYWPELVTLFEQAHDVTNWYEDLVEVIDEMGGDGFNLTEEEFCATAAEQLTGPLLGDVGPRRLVEFSALHPGGLRLSRWCSCNDNCDADHAAPSNNGVTEWSPHESSQGAVTLSPQ